MDVTAMVQQVGKRREAGEPLTFQKRDKSKCEPSAGMKNVLIWKPDSCASFAKTKATDCCCLLPCKGSSLSVMRNRDRLERLDELL